MDIDFEPTRGVARGREMDDELFPFILLHEPFQGVDVMVGKAPRRPARVGLPGLFRFGPVTEGRTRSYGESGLPD